MQMIVFNIIYQHNIILPNKDKQIFQKINEDIDYNEKFAKLYISNINLL
jgi:hypothetical protein